MIVFNLVAVLAGLAAIGAFFMGARAVVNHGRAQEYGVSGWTWHSVFNFFVFLTILTAPLSR
ncbi:MAG: hypothetical protein K0R53_701 [Burkholderiales bacterium]|jgi:hypothetical protein|nr:hypothetical protein [Burkholderiales bacterium]